MKKLIASLLALGLVLSGCASNKEEGPKTYEVALITDFGDVDDKSFNQGCYEGIQDYVKANPSVTYTYYKPLSASTADMTDMIDEAVTNGAKIIVLPGFKWAEAVYIAQDEYPDVHFVLVDDMPHNSDYTDYKTGTNTFSIMYKEHQSGFLAGYAAVKAGYTKLGFMGGMKTAAVTRYGYGFIAGAEYAAKEGNVQGVTVKFHYTGAFDATPEAQTLAKTWYQSGTEVIFGCGGALGNSVFAAAQEANGLAIGVDVDQSHESSTIITSAMKSIRLSVHDAIAAHYNESFPGGQNVTYGAEVGYVGLPEDFSKLNGFTKADYDAVYELLKNETIKPYSDTAATYAHELTSSWVTVDSEGLTD